MSKPNDTTLTPAAIMVDADKRAKEGNAMGLDELNAALANAERNAKGKKEVSMLKGISAGTWGLLSKGGPVQSGTVTAGHRRFFKGLLPRLPAKDAAQVRAILVAFKVDIS
jgi:hypothetical protein